MSLQKLITAITILAFVFSSCKAPLYQARWQDHPVIADGNPEEWKIPLRFYDSKSKLSYTVTNDMENLYICMRVTDDPGQVKIMRAGMQVWIDTTGKNNQTTGILFPQRATEPSAEQQQQGSSDGQGRRAGGGGGRQMNTGNVRNRFQKEYKEMQLTGFKAPIRGSVPLQNDFGINLGINWDANKYDSSFIMIYEAVIPFKTFYKNRLVPADSLKNFGISITVNALPRPAAKSGGGGGHGGGGGMSGGGMHGGGGGMGGGGGRHGGGGQHSAPEPANPLYETNIIKMRVQLSVHPTPEIKY